MTIIARFFAHTSNRNVVEFKASAHCRENLWHEVAERINEIEKELGEKVGVVVTVSEEEYDD